MILDRAAERVVGDGQLTRALGHSCLELRVRLADLVHELPDTCVGLPQLIRAEIERSLQHLAVQIRLAIGLVHRRHERAPWFLHGTVWLEMPPDLSPEQAVKGGHVHAGRSENVVTAIVWLCSSHLADGVNGAISPYE